jgi:hypothetical protein
VVEGVVCEFARVCLVVVDVWRWVALEGWAIRRKQGKLELRSSCSIAIRDSFWHSRNGFDEVQSIFCRR